ncbi:hypothetical protein [Azoarcus sp. DD4]|uniref:hypothetical protein n=1 Tax=Azoarcus sp. DD4 TaxID=2027405 RepID=UPI00143DBF4B|nr:hypothetical protein [Azoarcus sp. DD4]
MKSKISLVALLLTGALPLAAIAAEPTRPPAADAPPASTTPAMPDSAASKSDSAPMFKQLDRNSDGMVSKEEAKRSADVQARFSTLDADGNGSITLAEWTAAEKR